MPYGPINFRSIVIKLYYTNAETEVIPYRKTTLEVVIRVDRLRKETAKNAKRGRGRPRKNIVFLTEKEKTDFDLSLKLR